MSDLTLFTKKSPFDSIQQLRDDGTEFWSARDLMAVMGYSRWNEFKTPIDRAMKSAENQGCDVETLFRGSTDKSTGGRPSEDYGLSRFAAYLVAMNGDPNKTEVAAAQAYFAIRTREAEVAPKPVLAGAELLAYAVLEAQSMIAAKNAQIAELEPKAEFFDELMDANGCYSMLATSKVIGWGRNVMMRDLRRMGIIQGNNLPYQRYEHHFKVVPGTYTNRKTGETVPTATTFVRPSGVEFLRKKLNQAPAVVGDVA